MSLSVKMSGENVADLSVAAGKNDTEMGSHCQPRKPADRIKTSPFARIDQNNRLRINA
jgi:hypothetical protein